MSPESIPVVSRLAETGPDDRIFDSLLVLGPFFVACIALLGRSVLTQGLAVVYLAVFVGYVVYSAVVDGDGTGRERSGN